MKQSEFTSPPCHSCNQHDELEDTFINMKKDNYKQHSEILVNLDEAVANIKWMNVIGKWVLTTMLGYFVAIGYYILTSNFPTRAEVKLVKSRIDAGEKQHYTNENNIVSINAKLDFVIDKIIKEDK